MRPVGNDIKYKEWGPLTMEELEGSLPKVADVVNKWKKISVDNTIDRDEATIFFDSGEEK